MTQTVINLPIEAIEAWIRLRVELGKETALELEDVGDGRTKVSGPDDHVMDLRSYVAFVRQPA